MFSALNRSQTRCVVDPLHLKHHRPPRPLHSGLICVAASMRNPVILAWLTPRRGQRTQKWGATRRRALLPPPHLLPQLHSLQGATVISYVMLAVGSAVLLQG